MKITNENLRTAIAALRQCAAENGNRPTDTGHIRVTDLCVDVADYLESLKDRPAGRDLEEEYQRFIKAEWRDNPGKHTMSELCHLTAVHFAGWQKLRDMGVRDGGGMETVSDILSAADPLDAYALEVAFTMIPATCTEDHHMKNRDRIADAVRLGAEWQLQNNSKRMNRMVTYNGETPAVVEWGDMTGVVHERVTKSYSDSCEATPNKQLEWFKKYMED